jgi:flagellar basal-body rod protein FlgC
MLRSLDVSLSGLLAQRERMNTIAGNIANAQTTRSADGERVPFARRFVTFRPAADESAANGGDAGGGVGVEHEVHVDRNAPPRLVHLPGHPDADENGNVAFPAIDLMTEFVNAVEASRAYEANLAAMEMTKEMLGRTSRILA